MKKAAIKFKKYKYVVSKDKSNQAVLYNNRLLGFICLNKKAKIQCMRDGNWLTGPRWEITYKDGTRLENLPADRASAGGWLMRYEYRRECKIGRAILQST